MDLIMATWNVGTMLIPGMEGRLFVGRRKGRPRLRWIDDVSGITGGGVNPPPPKFRGPTKIVPNSTGLGKQLKIAEFWTPTPQIVQKKGSKILKLPSVRNCFTLAMTNKLVVIINSKKILLYEMKFHVPNYSCFQKP